MKEYIKKQFKNGEEYIQVLPMCIPEGYKELTEIVNKSYTLDDINGKLTAELKQPILPRGLNHVSVFNPFVFDFLNNNTEYLQNFYKGHKKGLKQFKKTYFKKYPSNSEAKSISDKFNHEFKQTIIELNSVFNKSNIGLLGFKNGILAGYCHYESDHLKEYIPIQPQTEQATTEKPPKELYDFLINDEIRPLLPKIYNQFKGTESKDMAILLYLLHNEKIIQYSKGSHKKGRTALARCFTKNINTNSVKPYFDPTKLNELKKEGKYYIPESDTEQIKSRLNEIIEKSCKKL